MVGLTSLTLWSLGQAIVVTPTTANAVGAALAAAARIVLGG
jgi:hypothetical protein